MLDKLKNFFEKNLTPEDPSDEKQRLKSYELAGAALMVEIMEADHDLDDSESAEFVRVLEESFNLTSEEIEEIVLLARQEAAESTSLYEFTRLINDHYDYNDKVRLIENLWRIAFADEKLDKYEEGMIRRIADLIHVSHGDFIQAKLKVRG